MATIDLYRRRDNRYGKYNAGVPGDVLADLPPAPMENEQPTHGVAAPATAQTSPAPTATETKPATDTPPGNGTDASNMPQLDNYHFYTDLANTYLKKPLTPEDEERRKRSATAVEGIAHLGNVLNAFSNLVFTGKGAPSQTLPKVPAGDLQRFEDRVAENRRRYIGMLADAKGRDRSAWLDDWKDEYNKQKMAKENELAQAELAYKQAQTDAAKERAEYQRLINAGVPEKQAAELAYKNAQIGTQKAIQYRNYQQGKNAYKAVDSAMDKDGNYYIRNSKLTDNEAKQIVQSSGLNGKDLDVFETGAEYDRRGTKTKAGKVDWQAAAAYAIQNGMLSREELEGRGFIFSGKGEKQSETQSVNRKKSPTGGAGKKSPTAS